MTIATVRPDTPPSDFQQEPHGLGNYPRGFNGFTWDRWQNNEWLSLLAASTRTTLTNSTDQLNFNCRGLVVWVNITAVPGGAQNLIVAIQERDPLVLGYTDLLVSATLNAISNTRLRVYPGITAIANLSLSSVLSRVWRVQTRPSGPGVFNYSIGACLIV